VTSFQWYKKDQ